MWDEINRHPGYRLGNDEGEGRMIDSPMCFRWGDLSYPGPNDVEGDLRQIGESVYVKDADEQVVCETTLYNKKMEKGYNLQHGNVFKNIITDLVRLGVKIDDKDKTILVCSLPGFYDHLVTTLSYGEDIINPDLITTTFLSLSPRRQNVEKGTQADNLYVKRGQDRGQNKSNEGSRKKRYKCMNWKTIQCYSCKQIGYWKMDSPNKKQGSSSSVNVVKTDDSNNEAHILCVSSDKCANV